MVEISDSEACIFHLSVPGTWMDAMPNLSDYAKAISPDGVTAVTANGFLPELEGDISVVNYWTEMLRPELEARFGDTLTVSEEGVTVPFAGAEGGRYMFQGKLGDETYYFMQLYIINGMEIYQLSFTSTSPIDPNQAEIAAIVDSFGF